MGDHIFTGGYKLEEKMEFLNEKAYIYTNEEEELIYYYVNKESAVSIDVDKEEHIIKK